MRRERWQQIDQILDEALQKERSQRKAFLDEACSGDASLRQEVESLLEAGEQAEGFIEAPALEEAAQAIAQNQVQSMVGREIGSYRILSLLGTGGMGEVYLAEDTNLPRKVALKFLTEQFGQDDGRLARFQREARLLASLNHPNIAAIHGLEETDGVRYLVLELVEGQTLAEQIAEGPIPVKDALRVALEIAQALEAAHEKGIIHRDLKPANVKITLEGEVKVLDFGLAKAIETELSEQAEANSSLLTMEATLEGTVLGTVAYMSPEQARGQVLDKRTDIYSFGVVLLEMLIGKGMYAGRSLTETLAAVIHQEPGLEDLPQDTPREIRELLQRCLRKDAGIRLRDMGDARITIAECLGGSTKTIGEVLLPAPTRPLWRRLTPWATVPLLAIAAWFLRFDPPPPEQPVSRFQIPLAKDQVLNHYFRQGVALSPNGNDLAFVSGQKRQSKEDLSTAWRQFWGHRTRKVSLWSLEQGKATPLADTSKSAHPFFSPGGKWLGVYSNRKLKKLPLEGGPSTTICDCPGSPYGVSWSIDDTIVFNCGEEGLSRVSASGGEPEQITELDKEAGEVSHRLPHVLPGGEAVLFTVVRHRTIPVDWGLAQIVVRELETGRTRVLIEGGSDGRYVPTGHLVFAREGTLMAAPFDLPSLALTGPAVPVLEGVSHAIHTANAERETGTAQFAFSDSGSLAYIGGSIFPEQKRQVVWVDRDGNVEPTGIEPGAYAVVRLSPDGSKVLLSRGYTSFDIWTHDLTRNTRTRQTFEGSNDYPIWPPHGTRFTFKSDRLGPETLFWKPVDGDGAAERLIPTPKNQATQAESVCRPQLV